MDSDLIEYFQKEPILIHFNNQEELKKLQRLFSYDSSGWQIKSGAVSFYINIMKNYTSSYHSASHPSDFALDGKRYIPMNAIEVFHLFDFEPHIVFGLP